MLRRTQKPLLINDIDIVYGGEPSAFAREIQIIFTRACNKAIGDLRKRDFQPVGSDSPTQDCRVIGSQAVIAASGPRLS